MAIREKEMISTSEAATASSRSRSIGLGNFPLRWSWPARIPHRITPAMLMMTCDGGVRSKPESTDIAVPAAIRSHGEIGALRMAME